MTKRKRGQTGVRLVLHQPEVLSQLLSEIATLWGTRGASRRIGLDAGHFTRLRAGKYRSISGTTVAKLLRVLEPRELARAFDHPELNSRLAKHARWLAGELQKYGREGVEHGLEPLLAHPLGLVSGGAAVHPQHRSWRAARYAATRKWSREDYVRPPWAPRHLELIRMIGEDKRYKGYLEPLHQVPPGLGTEVMEYLLRVELALYRVVDPLLAGGESGGIEFTFDELADSGKLATYLRAAVRRECILLERGSRYTRAGGQVIPVPRPRRASRRKSTVKPRAS